MAAVLELRPVADCGDNRRGGLGADAFDLRNAQAGIVVVENLFDFLVEGGDPPIEVPE